MDRDIRARRGYVDIGANIGIYAIYAGIVGARVLAFEPEALNYAELNKNIYVNNLHGRVTSYCMAITDVVDVSVLYLSAFSFAGSHHDFGENRWDSDMVIGGRNIDRETRPQQGLCLLPARRAGFAASAAAPQSHQDRRRRIRA